MRVRLQDIADRVEVSRGAVSKVLNDRPIRIGEAKRRRILDLARELDYRTDMMARALKKKGSRSVGIVVPTMKTLFYPELIAGIETRLFAKGYQTLICNTDDRPSRERRHLEDLVCRRVEGLVICPTARMENLDLVRTIHRTECPVIFVDRCPAGNKFPSVTTDNRAAARKGVRFLARRGIARLAYVGEAVRNPPLEERLAGVRGEARQLRLPLGRGRVLLCGFDREEVRLACASLLKNRRSRTGVFLESNRFLMGLLDAAAESGLGVPDDVPVVGFDAFQPDVGSARDIRSLGALRGPPAILVQDVVAIAERVSTFLLSGDREGAGRSTKVPARLLAP